MTSKKAAIRIDTPEKRKLITADYLISGRLYYLYEESREDYARNVLYMRVGSIILTIGESGQYLSWNALSISVKQKDLYFRAESGTTVSITLTQD